MRNQGYNGGQSYRRFGDEVLRNINNHSDNHHLRDNGYNDYNGRSNERERERVHTYNPPTRVQGLYHNTEQGNGNVDNPHTSTRTNLHADDSAFAAVAKAILLEIQQATSANDNEADRSITTALHLNKIMSRKELMDLNNALHSRVASSWSPGLNPSKVDTLVHECEKTFGEELRMLILRNDPTSTSHSNYMPSTDRRKTSPTPSPSQNVHRFPSPEGNNIDLTNHIIYDDDRNPSPMRQESSSFGYDSLRRGEIYSNATSVTALSSEDDGDDSEIYTIQLDDIKQKGMSPTFNQLNRDKRSPTSNRVRFQSNLKDDSFQSQSVATPTKKQSMLSRLRQEIEVVAPATLPENFMFEAKMGDEMFMVVVPKGGVRKGEVFKSFKVDIDSVSVDEPTGRLKNKTDMNTPIGYWRHNLFDCFRYGFCHPLLLNSIFCPHIALAQIMARMKLNNIGGRSMELRSRIRVSTVIFIPTIIVGLNGLMIFLMIRGFYLHLQNIFRVFLCGSIIMLVVDTMIVTYFYTLLIRTRRQVRYEYNIPVEGFGEDALYSIFCAPCAITQMGQHTADYSTYVATCCTDTGLSRHIELKFPNDLVAEQV